HRAGRARLRPSLFSLSRIRPRTTSVKISPKPPGARSLLRLRARPDVRRPEVRAFVIRIPHALTDRQPPRVVKLLKSRRIVMHPKLIGQLQRLPARDSDPWPRAIVIVIAHRHDSIEP